MKNIIIYLPILFAIYLSSCSRYIGPPLAGANNISYLPRPFIMDSAKFKTYANVEYSLGESRDGITIINSGSVNLSQAYANENFNASIGAFGFFGGIKYKDTFDNGNYLNPNVILTDEYQKSFMGWGLRSIIGFQKVSSDKLVNYRIISWENAYSQEYGDYSKFRNSVVNESDVSRNNEAYIYVSKFKNIFTTGISSEILWNKAFDDKEFSLGARAFIGFSPKLLNSFNRIPYSYKNEESEKIAPIIIGSFYLNYKSLFGVLQIGGGDRLNLIKTGIGYTF